jgi:hypothetical protein
MMDAEAFLAAVASGRKVCVHCEKRVRVRPRGLCWPCYYTPSILALYPSTSKYGRRGVGHGHRRRAPLPKPDPFLWPGSEEKIAAMAGRAARGEQLFHPGEAFQRFGVNPAVKPGTLHMADVAGRLDRPRDGVLSVIVWPFNWGDD